MARQVALMLGTAIMTVLAITGTQERRTDSDNGSLKELQQPCNCSCERSRNGAFEYKVVLHPFFDPTAPERREKSPTAMEEALLNRMGRQGWRVVDASNESLVFERRIEKQAVAEPQENVRPKEQNTKPNTKGNDPSDGAKRGRR